MSEETGFSGRLARHFLNSELTPLLALAAMLLGAFALLVTPREEEPQIDVTFANVFVPFPGAAAAEVENLVATPMERVLGEISGVEHIYSVSRPGMAVLTVQFEVGEKRSDAIVRLYNAVYSNRDWRPEGVGILEPLIRPMGIDDVPILTLALWTADSSRSALEMGQVAHAIEAQIQRVAGTRNVYTIGAPGNTVHVTLDPQRLAGFDLTALELLRSLEATNLVRHAGELVGANRVTPLQAGRFLADRDEVAALVVGVHEGRPVYLQDVAQVRSGPDVAEELVWFGTKQMPHAPAVTIAVSKKPGTNASDVAARVIERIEALKGTFIPAGVETTVTRNYGVTADDKAQKLMQKLLFATLAVVALVFVAVGRREAAVVGAAVIVTLAATLFASWAWGFTINRVSLFALIFAIGILVDDAIVIVENIERHLYRGGEPDTLIERAVDEVGGPTILATFTVIAALLPMAFVSGLMGPYMSPIPINASMGMVISLAVALVFTPWLCRRLLAARSHQGQAQAAWLQRLFERLLTPFTRSDNGRRNRHWLYGAVAAAIVLAVALVAVQWVVLKMLPFDNKSEFQVVLDMPEGTTLEDTARTLDELAQVIAAVPEVTDYQAYAGTAAPINFNGLVRQYYLRRSPHAGDLQVNLVDKHHRDRSSHEIAAAVRPALAEVGRRHGAVVQVVEVPPGPPVQAPLVAEVYGPSYVAQRERALALRQLFEDTPDIVDVDTSVEAPAQRWTLPVDRQKAALLGVDQAAAVQTAALAVAGRDATYVHTGREHYPIPVRVGLGSGDKASLEPVQELEVRNLAGARVPLSEITRAERQPWDGAIIHKDLSPVVFVTGDMAGRLDSPLYGMFRLVDRIEDEQRFISAPEDPAAFAIKWDGEWQITYETFRDMGLAYSVGLVLIYLLVVAQFRSYVVPLIIMAPIPLTVIGVMPGHALLGAQFTATSMIGMIALAGIIVRNSILLVDFVDAERAAGRDLASAVIRAGAIRARPIALTALAAMAGAFFILDDPIFNGLAVSLIFGILVSTALTLLVIPVLYFALRQRTERRLAARAAVMPGAAAR
jgi:multidrug efflux pump subunit AcrB